MTNNGKAIAPLVNRSGAWCFLLRFTTKCNLLKSPMKKQRPLLRSTLFLVPIFLLCAPLPTNASDHADPLVLNPLRPPKEKEPRITDLHVFLDKDQDPSLADPKALVLDLCVFPAMPPLARAGNNETGPTIELSLPPKMGPGTAQYKIPKLNPAGYKYDIYIDLHAK